VRQAARSTKMSASSSRAAWGSVAPRKATCGLISCRAIRPALTHDTVQGRQPTHSLWRSNKSMTKVETRVRLECAWDGCGATFAGDMPHDWAWLLFEFPDMLHGGALCPQHAVALERQLKKLRDRGFRCSEGGRNALH